MPTANGVEEDVLALIRSGDVQDAVVDLAEAGIDQLLKDGFLRDVPILGSVMGVIRATGSVRDLLLAKKLGRFLLALQSVPLDERERFHDSLGSRAEARRVGEALLLLLDRLDDMQKPELVARLFRARIRGEIDGTTFQQMATAVDRLLIAHLPPLVSFYSGATEGPPGTPVDRDLFQALSFAGLVRVEARGDGGGMFSAEFAGAVIHYVRNELGEKFVKIITRDA